MSDWRYLKANIKWNSMIALSCVPEFDCVVVTTCYDAIFFDVNSIYMAVMSSICSYSCKVVGVPQYCCFVSWNAVNILVPLNIEDRILVAFANAKRFASIKDVPNVNQSILSSRSDVVSTWTELRTVYLTTVSLKLHSLSWQALGFFNLHKCHNYSN